MVNNIKDGTVWAEDVFECLFMVAVDYESPELLEELLELAHNTDLDDHEKNTPFLPWDPQPNSQVLVMACKRNNFALVRLLVDRGYRLKPKIGNFEKEEAKTTKRLPSWALCIGSRMMQGLMNLAFQRMENKDDELFEASDQIQNLRIMELAVNPSYILACYTSVAEKYDWRNPIPCECSKVSAIIYLI